MQHRSSLLLAAPRCNTRDSWQSRVRLRHTLTTIVLATATCFPVGVHAADAKLSGFHGSPHVMMMIGGSSDAGDIATPPAPPLPAERGKSSDEIDKLSVIIQPGVNTQSMAFELPSTAVTSRVMALAPLVNQAAAAADVDSALLMAVINAPCVGIWAAFGVGLRRFLTEPSRLRVFNVTMAGLLVLSLYPIFLN